MQPAHAKFLKPSGNLSPSVIMHRSNRNVYHRNSKHKNTDLKHSYGKFDLTYTSRLTYYNFIRNEFSTLKVLLFDFFSTI